MCSIPLPDILAVERVHEDSFKKNNMFQVVQPERVLYIQVSLISLFSVIQIKGAIKLMFVVILITGYIYYCYVLGK